MKILFRLLVAVCLLGAAYGQRNAIPTFSAADSFGTDTINLVTLKPVLNFPVISKAGAIPFGLYITSPQSCGIVTTAQGKSWTCDPGATSGTAAFMLTTNLLGMTGSYYAYSIGNCQYFEILKLVGVDGSTTYPLNSSTTVIGYPSGCGSNSATLYTTDGSGYTVTFTAINAAAPSVTVYAADGSVGSTTAGSSVNSLADPFGNTISRATTTFTDTLGAKVTVNNSGVTPGTYPTQYTYTDSNGNSQNVNLIAGSQVTVIPPTGCGASSYSVTPIASVSYPDETSYGITWQANGSGISGLVGSVTLRTGGVISYGYTVAPNSCNTTLTSLTRTTPDGITTYSTSNGVTTVLDPGKNRKVYTFSGTFLTQLQEYQNTGSVSSPSYTLVSTTTYCYNTNQTNCPTASVVYPITQRDVYSYTGSASKAMTHTTEVYDANGNMTSSTAYDYITAQTLVTTTTFSGCGQGSTILNHPCDVKTVNGSNTVSETKFTYNTNGATLSESAWTGSQWLTTSYSPNTTGTVASVTDPNTQVTTFGYANGCNNLLPTSASTTVNGVVISSSQTWDCNTALILTTTDANSHTPAANEYDSMLRLTQTTDNVGFSVTMSYTSNSITETPSFGTPSTRYFDSLGRPSISQKQQSSGSQYYDTISATYQWNGTNFQTQNSAACTQTSDLPCSTYNTGTANPIRGPIGSTNALNGTIAYAYNANDVSLTAGPAPSGEHVKTAQTELDGFGRTQSVCALETSGGTACGQVMGNSGILTSYTYSFAAGSSTVTETRGSQTHTTVSDATGRITTSTTPERGTITSTYDSYPSPGVCGGWTSEPGDLMATLKNSGIQVCYVHDGLHRLTTESSSVGNNTCKRFRYDATANGFFTPPTGYPTSNINVVGRLVEAETDNCTAFPPTSATMITDEWFAYDADGRTNVMCEATPHSGGYYCTTVGYNPDGSLASISGIPGYTAYTFGVDGEGRPSSASQGSTTIIYSTAYDAASKPTTVEIGTNSADVDTFTYNALEQMTNYSFTIGGKTMSGTPGWNPIGSLGSLNITDTFNSGGAQNCMFAYDDVARIVDDNCGSSLWHQAFGYGSSGNDQYDNLTKAGNPGTSWTPGYNYTNNQMIGSSYDADGNLLYDGTNTYVPDGYGKLLGARTGNSAVSCGSTGSYCATYDAAGNLVETSNGSTYRELLLSPVGRLAQMNGQTTQNAYIELPGGLSLNASGTGGATRYIQHPDWLGSKRLSTSLGNRSQIFDTAYTPYGESYDTFGTLKADFTGDLQDIFAGLFDTPNRELAQNSSRWQSPDPAGASWNGYAYVTDPNSATDPSGLQDCDKYGLGCNAPAKQTLDGGGALIYLSGSNAQQLSEPPSNVQVKTAVVPGTFGSDLATFGLNSWGGGRNGVISRPTDMFSRFIHWSNVHLLGDTTGEGDTDAKEQFMLGVNFAMGGEGIVSEEDGRMIAKWEEFQRKVGNISNSHFMQTKGIGLIDLAWSGDKDAISVLRDAQENDREIVDAISRNKAMTRHFNKLGEYHNHDFTVGPVQIIRAKYATANPTYGQYIFSQTGRQSPVDAFRKWNKGGD